MTFRQLLEEGRVYRVQTIACYWDVHGVMHDERDIIDWENSCMTKHDAMNMWYKLPQYVNRDHVDCRDYSTTIREMAEREDPDDTRSIHERQLHEQTWKRVPYVPKKKKRSDGIPMWANIVFGVPLSIIRSALKM